MSMSSVILQTLITTWIFWFVQRVDVPSSLYFTPGPYFGFGIDCDCWYDFLAISIVSPAAPLFLGRVDAHP